MGRNDDAHHMMNGHGISEVCEAAHVAATGRNFGAGGAAGTHHCLCMGLERFENSLCNRVRRDDCIELRGELERYPSVGRSSDG